MILPVSKKFLRKFVRAYCDGEIFTSADVPGDTMERWARNVRLSFVPTAMGALEGVDLNDLGVLWEYYKESMPRGINGMPMFFSVKMMNRADWEVATQAIEKELQRRKEVVL